MAPAQWSLENGKLVRSFEFEDFDTAFDFADEVREIANDLEHHPEISISWGKVIISTITHDKGKVTELDYELAEAVDLLFDEGFEEIEELEIEEVEEDDDDDENVEDDSSAKPGYY